MTVRRIALLSLLALCLVGASVALRAQAQQSHENEMQEEALLRIAGQDCDWLCRLKERQAQQFEGSWAITNTPVVPPGVPQPPSVRGYATVSRGGGYFGSSRSRPLAQHHGSWAHLGGNDFAFTFTEDIFDAMGNFAGTLTVRGRITMTGRDTFVGVGNGEQRDAAGNLVFNRCGTLRAERIKVEPLSPQCQSITPPQ